MTSLVSRLVSRTSTRPMSSLADLEEKELRIPVCSRSKSESEGEEEEGPNYHGDIDLGADVEIGSDRVDIEANIGQQGEKRERERERESNELITLKMKFYHPSSYI